MATKIFWARPNIGGERNTEPRVQSVRFGDGYELRVRDGINTGPITWSGLVFTASFEEHDRQVKFIEDCAGVDSFAWVDPRGEERRYVCRRWVARQAVPGVYELSCDFEEVFDL